MFLKTRTACTVLLLLLSCNCLGLGKKVDHLHGGSTTPSNTSQPHAADSADAAVQTRVAPTAPPPPCKEDDQPPAYEAPPSYEEATVSSQRK